MAGISEMKANIVSVGGGILIFMITAVIMVFMTIEYNKAHCSKPNVIEEK